MSNDPDIQYFAESGMWIKPDGAVRVDGLLCPGGGGGSLAFGEVGRDGEDGALHAWSLDPGRLPERVEVAIGRGGKGAAFEHVKAGDGADGYALIITHLRQEER